MSPFGSNFHHDSFEYIGPQKKPWNPPDTLNYRSNTSINIDISGIGRGMKTAAKWGFWGNVVGGLSNIASAWLLSRGNEKGATILGAGMGIAGSIFGGGYGFGGDYYGGGYNTYGAGGGYLVDYPNTYVMPFTGFGGTVVGGGNANGNNNGANGANGNNNGANGANGNNNGANGANGNNNGANGANGNNNGANGANGNNNGANGANGNNNGANGANGNNNGDVKANGQGFYDAIKDGNATAVATNNGPGVIHKTIAGKITLGANNAQSNIDDKQDTNTNYPNSFTITDTSINKNGNKYVFEFVELRTINGKQTPIYKVKDETASPDDTKSGQSDSQNFNSIRENEYTLDDYNGGKIKLTVVGNNGASFSSI